MRIRYLPLQSNSKTHSFQYIDENTIILNGETYEFDCESVSFDLEELLLNTNGMIAEAYRDETGELYLTLRKYVLTTDVWGASEYEAYR